jgi:hypothetical protein
VGTTCTHPWQRAALHWADDECSATRALCSASSTWGFLPVEARPFAASLLVRSARDWWLSGSSLGDMQMRRLLIVPGTSYARVEMSDFRCFQDAPLPMGSGNWEGGNGSVLEVSTVHRLRCSTRVTCICQHGARYAAVDGLMCVCWSSCRHGSWPWRGRGPTCGYTSCQWRVSGG